MIVRQMQSHFEYRCAGIEDDAFAGVDERGGGNANPRFFSWVLARFGLEGLRGLRTCRCHGAAVNAAQTILRFENFQIAPNGRVGHAKRTYQFGDANRTLLLNLLRDFQSALVGGERHLHSFSFPMF